MRLGGYKCSKYIQSDWKNNNYHSYSNFIETKLKNLKFKIIEVKKKKTLFVIFLFNIYIIEVKLKNWINCIKKEKYSLKHNCTNIVINYINYL